MSSIFLTFIGEHMLIKRYAKRAIETYLYWVKAFINFYGKLPPSQCHEKEVELF